MASDTHVILVDPQSGSARYVEDRLRRLEALWSRFLPGGDTSAINRAANEWVEIGSETVTLIETMQAASDLTDGRFDPTLLYELRRVGYAASIDDQSQRSVTVDLPCPNQTIHDLVIDRPGSAVWVPSGLGFDPGGIGKGLAADIAVTELLACGVGGALVGIGGDLAAAGSAPTDAGWRVTVEDPADETQELLMLDFDGGGVATSSTQSRRWRHHGRRRHHLIDPSRRTCSDTDLAAVTVVAASGWEAEVHATAAILAGLTQVTAYLESHGLTGVAVANDGRVSEAGQLRTENAKAVAGS